LQNKTHSIALVAVTGGDSFDKCGSLSQIQTSRLLVRTIGPAITIDA